MTKPDVLAPRRQGHHIPNFNLVGMDNDPIDQQLHQLPPLLKIRLRQSLRDSGAKGLDRLE
jgi:hypothetical protein